MANPLEGTPEKSREMDKIFYGNNKLKVRDPGEDKEHGRRVLKTVIMK